jgi:putative hydrolase of the HAD superfamily
MVAAEEAHWKRVLAEHWSGPPSGVVAEGFRNLGTHPTEGQIVAVLDAYAAAVDGAAYVFPDSRAVLEELRADGYRLGLLSNTWWAAAWHNADLATHGLAGLLHELVYTSDLAHSKPHPEVFRHAARLLGVPMEACVMVGDWPEFDIDGALNAGMRGIWKTSGRPRPEPPWFTPTARIEHLAELPPLLRSWA